MDRATASLDVGALVDTTKIGLFNITVLVLGALILFVDGFDTLVIAFITPQLARAWDIPHSLLGPIFSSGLVGLLVGYLLVSPLSSRFGHKRTIIASVLLFGVLTALTTLALDVPFLILFRFLTGIGLGGAIPSAVALTGEYCPRSRRSTFITFMYTGYSLGQVSAGLVSAFLLRSFGWPAVLWVGALLALALAAVLIVALPESLEYLVNRSQDRPGAIKVIHRLAPNLPVSEGTALVAEGGQAIAVIELFRNQRAAGTLAIWIALFMNLMVLFGLQNWLPTIFVDVGLPQETAITASSIGVGGGIFAALVLGPLMDRFGPYKIMTSLFLVGALFVALIGAVLSSSVTILVATTVAAGFCTSGLQKSANALAIYFYPTALRSTGLGWGLGIGRIGAIIGPLAVGLILELKWHPSTVFYASVLPMVCGAVVISLMGRTYAAAAGGRRFGAQAPTLEGEVQQSPARVTETD
jgi:AAHS family 4-hydroxybenzoate transporter-like MFS transporter